MPELVALLDLVKTQSPMVIVLISWVVYLARNNVLLRQERQELDSRFLDVMDTTAKSIVRQSDSISLLTERVSRIEGQLISHRPRD